MVLDRDVKTGRDEIGVEITISSRHPNDRDFRDKVGRCVMSHGVREVRGATCHCVRILSVKQIMTHKEDRIKELGLA